MKWIKVLRSTKFVNNFAKTLIEKDPSKVIYILQDATYFYFGLRDDATWRSPSFHPVLIRDLQALSDNNNINDSITDNEVTEIMLRYTNPCPIEDIKTDRTIPTPNED